MKGTEIQKSAMREKKKKKRYAHWFYLFHWQHTCSRLDLCDRVVAFPADHTKFPLNMSKLHLLFKLCIGLK